ncbi:MAG: hypothetical protein M3R50_00105 [Bacteroidota bacterium]|nr:hypothetical protein [Bacteroidota bacterium]
MNRFFSKYRGVVINGLILFSLVTAMILQDGTLKDFFIGIGTGAALINFGRAIGDLKSKNNSNYIKGRNNNDSLNMN